MAPETVPGRPCIFALIDHGIGSRPYFARIVLVHIVYLSSESIRRPSMSKRHARTGGKLKKLLAKDGILIGWTYSVPRDDMVLYCRQEM